jgi:MFS family permease
MIIGALGASVLLLVAFVFIERRASEPLIPFDLFKIPTLLASNAIGLGIGMIMFGTLSFLPLFVQVVNRSSATQAGRILTPMMLAMVVASPIAARLILKVGYRSLTVAGFGFALLGTFLLTRLDMSTSEFETGVCMVFIGLGVGICFLTTILAAQNSVDLPRMGVATGLVNFTRQLGGALGVAVAGAVMLTSLTNRIADLFPGQHIPAGALLSAQTAKSFPAETQDAVRGAFAHSLHLVFVTMFVITVVAALTTLLMPRGKPVLDEVAEQDGHLVDEATLPDGETFAIVSPIDGVDASEPSDEDQPAVGATGLPR